MALYLTYYCEITHTLFLAFYLSFNLTFGILSDILSDIVFGPRAGQLAIEWPATTWGGGGPVLLKSRDPTWQVGKNVPKGKILPNQ